MRTLASRLALAALEQATRRRKPAPGLVHHFDRGVQYASDAYVGALAKCGMTASMSRPANPYDNTSCIREVPLSDRALAILRQRCDDGRAGWLFPPKRTRSGPYNHGEQISAGS